MNSLLLNAGNLFQDLSSETSEGNGEGSSYWWIIPVVFLGLVILLFIYYALKKE